MLSSTSRIIDDYFSVPEEFKQIVHSVRQNQTSQIEIDDALMTSFKCKPEEYQQLATEQMAELGSALANNTSVVKLTVIGFMFPRKAFPALMESLKKNKTLATLKVDIYSPQELASLAEILTHNTGLKYLALSVLGAAENEYLPVIAKNLETHKTLLSFEIFDSAQAVNEKTTEALKDLARKNTTLMSCALESAMGSKREFCQEVRDEECAHASVPAKPASEAEELDKLFQPIENVVQQPALAAEIIPAPAMLFQQIDPPQIPAPDMHTQHLQNMLVPELRAAELENILSPDFRSHELELSIAQAQHQQEQLIRDMERKVNLDIENTIANQTRIQEQNVYTIERKLAQDEKAMRDIELRMTREARAGRIQFGLLQPVAVPQPPKQIPQQTKHIPFTKDEIALVREYLENIYTHSTSAIEKRTIDNLRCPISAEIMEFPVFLIPDRRTYDRCELIKQLSQGKNVCPLSGKPFTERDLMPDHGMISIIQEFLEDAIKAKAKPDGEKKQPSC